MRILQPCSTSCFQQIPGPTSSSSSHMWLCHWCFAWYLSPLRTFISLVGNWGKSQEEYIAEALEKGFIQHSTSPASPGFFFIGKNSGGLLVWNDYWGLNSITMKYHCPLPLVFSSPRTAEVCKDFLNWISATPTTWSASVKEASGKWPFPLTWGTMNI